MPSETIDLGVLTVRRLGFGTMQLTGAGVWGPPADRDEAVRVLRGAVEFGVNLIDTADSYGPNVAEELIREALYPYSEDITIATKAGFTRPGPGQWRECGLPAYLRAQCEGSLKRLGVEQIDLFQLHRIDPHVDEEEQFGVLRALRDEGKIREVGLSEVTTDQIDRARRTVPVVSVQNLYNLAQRKADDVVDYCDENHIGFIPWFPLGSGKLSGVGGPLHKFASELGATESQIAIAWLLRRSSMMLPIPGTSSLEHLAENCEAAKLSLSDSVYRELTNSRREIRRWAKSS